MSALGVAVGALVAVGILSSAGAANATPTTHTLTVTVKSVAGAALSGLVLEAIPVSDGHEIVGDDSSTGAYPKAKAVKGKAGTYEFTSLGNFDHTIYFATATKSTFSQLLGGVSALDRAQVVSPAQTKLDVSLATNATITGTVRSPSGTLLSKATVEAYRYNGSSWDEYSITRTSSKGAYTLTDIDPGSYTLEFSSPTDSYEPMFLGDVATADTSTGFTVDVGTTVKENWVFPNYTGAISGKTRAFFPSYGTFPLTKATAVAFPYSRSTGIDYSHPISSAKSSSTGAWTIKNLAPGSYQVEIIPYYLNEASAFITDATNPYSTGLGVGAGLTTVTGNSEVTVATNGAYATVEVHGTTGWQAGTYVLFQRTDDPAEYYTGTTNSAGQVVFGKVKSNFVLQPGEFTVTVLPSAASTDGPAVTTCSLKFGHNTCLVSTAAKDGTAGFTTTPTISGASTEVGTSYSVSASSNRAHATLSYQWLRDGHPIYGATKSMYVSRPSDIGTHLSARVESSEFGYATDYATADAPGQVTDSTVQPTMETAPYIDPFSDIHVGTTLHLNPGKWSLSGMTYSYEWIENGSFLGDTTDSYTVTDADLGKNIWAEVLPSKAGYPTLSPALTTPISPTTGSAPTLIAPLTFTTTTKGIAKGFVEYTVNPSTWSGPATSVAYDWTAAVGAISGASDGSSVLVSTAKTALLAPVSVELTAEVDGFTNSGTALASARAATTKLLVGSAPTVSVGPNVQSATSTVEQGASLTVSPGVWNGADGVVSDPSAYTYQWYAKADKATATAIYGATSSSYTPTTPQIGDAVSVKVTALSASWASASVTVAGGSVVGSSLLASDEPTIHFYGDDTPRDPITASFTDEWYADGAAVTYAWYTCAPSVCTSSSPISAYTPVGIPTGLTFYPPASLANSTVILVVTGTRVGLATTQVKSAPITILPTGFIPVVSEPTYNITSVTPSTVRVGQSLVAEIAFGQSPSIGYQWQYCPSDCLTGDSNWTPQTSGYSATSAFVPMPDMLAGYVRFEAQATKQGYTTRTVDSTPLHVTQGQLSDVVPAASVSGSLAGGYSLNVGNLPNYVSATPHWIVDGTEVSTDNSYTVDPAASSLTYYLAVVYSASGFASDLTTIVPIHAAPLSLTAQTVTMSGTTVGDTMTLSPAVPWNLPDLPYVTWVMSYLWDSGSGQTYSTQPSYPAGGGAAGSLVRVTISVSSELYGRSGTGASSPNEVHSQSSAPIIAGSAITSSNGPGFHWDGSLDAGVTVTVLPLDYSIDGVTSSYVWQKSADEGSSWTTISGASGDQYTATLADAGDQLRVTVTGAEVGYPSYTGTSNAIAVAVGTPIRELEAPSIDASAQVGVLDHLNSGEWSSGSTVHIQWMLNGNPVAGATSATYTPVATDSGDELSAEVTASEPGELDLVEDTGVVAIQNGDAPIPTKQPKVTGTKTLSVTEGTWNLSGLTFSYQWVDVDSSFDLSAATSNTYTLKPGELLANVAVTVTVKRDGYETGSDTVPN